MFKTNKRQELYKRRDYFPRYGVVHEFFCHYAPVTKQFASLKLSYEVLQMDLVVTK